MGKVRKKVVDSKKVNVRTNLKYKVASLAVILSIATTCISLGIYERNENNRVKHENAYGYEDVNPWDYFKVKSDDFVILNAGDYDTLGTILLDRKIDVCNKNDISVGLVIMSEADNEEEIYNDVEHVKSILSKHKIDYPIYLNIDKIIENDNLNVDMKTKLIKNFLEKCQSNNMYVGIHGKDSNLCRVKKYCKIVDYDAFVIMDEGSNEVKYDGNYTLYKDGEKIVSKTNLVDLIKEKELNLSDRFLKDGKHIVQKDENILDISCKYGLSVNELLAFNDLKKEDIHEGMTLRIPSLIDKSIPGISNERERLEEPLLGCDISYAQGTNIDWNKMNENFEFVIARVSYGMDLDPCFESNIKNCNYYNIPVGVYCFNNVRRNDLSDEDFKKQCEKQADFVIQNLSNKRIDYPVYLDIEKPNGPITDIYSRDDVKIMLDVWYNKMLESGYEPGLYTGMDGFKYISNWVDYDINEKFHTWIAGGVNYKEERNFDDCDVLPSEYTYQDKDYVADIRQVSDAGINGGAGNGSGHLDINYSYIDYSKDYHVNNNLDDPLFGIKDFIQLPNASQVGILTGTLAGASLLAASAYIIGKQKSKNR